MPLRRELFGLVHINRSGDISRPTIRAPVQKNVEKAAPDGAGDAWTFTAIDADAKLIVSYLVSGERDGESALAFMDDLRGRLEDRPQVTTDGLSAYVGAVEGAFGGDVDFAQVIKEYGKEPGESPERKYSPPVCTRVEKRRVEGNPDLRTANTSYVERHNLTMRRGCAGSPGSPTPSASGRRSMSRWSISTQSTTTSAEFTRRCE